MRRDTVPPVSCPREHRQAAFEVDYLTVEHAQIFDGQSRLPQLRQVRPVRRRPHLLAAQERAVATTPSPWTCANPRTTSTACGPPPSVPLTSPRPSATNRASTTTMPMRRHARDHCPGTPHGRRSGGPPPQHRSRPRTGPRRRHPAPPRENPGQRRGRRPPRQRLPHLPLRPPRGAGHGCRRDGRGRRTPDPWSPTRTRHARRPGANGP